VRRGPTLECVMTSPGGSNSDPSSAARRPSMVPLIGTKNRFREAHLSEAKPDSLTMSASGCLLPYRPAAPSRMICSRRRSRLSRVHGYRRLRSSWLRCRTSPEWSRLGKRRPRVITDLRRQRVELAWLRRVNPWPSIATPSIKERGLLGKVERLWQCVIGDGRIPFHRLGNVVEVTVAKSSS
jgi:hypothetical protein